MEHCDKCGIEIEDKWEKKHIIEDNILCKSCMDKELFNSVCK